MKSKFLFYVLFLASVNSAFSQVTGPNGYLPNYDPPSPEASTLANAIDHPVGYFTGIPKIEIPLFTIKTGRITVPISLSYHAGVKVNDIASRVGSGWVLNAGGVITRTVKGYPDDVGVTTPSSANEYSYFSSSSNVSQSYNNLSEGFNYYDLEPDEYFYNFGSKTGKMYVTSPTTPVVCNDDPIKVTSSYTTTYNGNVSGIISFTIVDENGLIYTFSNLETTYVDNWGSIAYTYSSAWYLTSISDPVTNKSVTFQYRPSMPTLNYSIVKSLMGAPNCGASPGNNTTQTIIYNSQVLSKISYDEGFIEFDANLNRTDLTGDLAYTQISNYVYLGATTQALVKSFNLGYTTVANGSGAQENYRLYLDNLTETGSDGTAMPPYLFYYLNRASLPQRQSLQQDIWGYYNANGVTGTSPQFAKVYVHNAGMVTDYLPFDNPSNPAPTTIAGVETSANPTTAMYGTLNQITYPTGGHTSYTYELNQFQGVYSGAGIRIKNITDYSSAGQQLLSKTYQYNNSGFLGGPYPQVAYPTATGVVRFSLNQTVLGSSQGSYVGYSQVTEIQNSSTGSNGKKDYYYTVDPDVSGTFSAITNTCSDLYNLSSIRSSSYFPFFEMESREGRRGLLTKETYTDSLGTLRREIDYNYTLVSNNIAGVYSTYITFDQVNAGVTTVELSQRRDINAIKMLLNTKTQIDFLGPAPQQRIVDSTTYSYCGGAFSDQFLRTVSHFSSGLSASQSGQGGSTIYIPNTSTQITYKYPFDYATTAMRSMSSMNYLSPVINEFSTVTNNLASTPITYYTGSKITNYQQNPYYSAGSAPNMIVPAQTYAVNLPAPMQQQPGGPGANPTVEVADPSSPGSLYDARVQFLNYDANSNPTLIQHDKLYEALSWSPDGEHLLSKATTANPVGVIFSSPPSSWNQVIDISAKTGVIDYVWGGSQTAFPISPDGVHPLIVSFWARNGTFNITVNGNLSVGSIVINQTAPATWKYYSIPLSTIGSGWAGAPVYLTGSAMLDDVSISSAAGECTSYAYDAFQRPQLTMDPAGNVRSFEYDSFGRLLNIKDINGNIIKSNCYNYAGQSYGCAIGPPTLAYAFTLTNSTGVAGFVATFTSGSNYYSYNFPTSGSAIYQIPPGTYTVQIGPINAPTNRKFLLGGRAPVTAPGVTFSNVIVGAPNTETPLIIELP